MRSEKLQDALGMVDGELIARAKKVPPKKDHRMRWIAGIAAMLAVVMLVSSLFGSKSPLPPNYDTYAPIELAPFALTYAQYPAMAKYPLTGTEWSDYNSEEYNAWWEDVRARRQFYGAGEGLEEFFSATISTFLIENGEKNTVYSPLNVYMALAMLAEISDGGTREQILSLLGSENIEALRTQANAVWNANYCNDGTVTSILGSSIWLDEDISYRQKTLEALTEYYYASALQGEMGSEELNRALAQWLNEQTGGLLEGHLSDVSLPAEAVLALASTLYYNVKWEHEFFEQNNTKRVFYSPYDSFANARYEFMNQTISGGDYYWGNRFTAVRKRLENSGSMYFILPDEGFDVDTLLSDGEALSFMIANGDWENHSMPLIHLSLPKFDVTSSMDLRNGLEKLGITDCFSSSAADFSPLLQNHDTLDAAINKVTHAARVKIDEKGIEAAAFTVLPIHGGMPQDPTKEVDFILDRPFIYVITGEDGLPLFVGTVYEP